MRIKQIFEKCPGDDRRLYQMAGCYRIAGWMDICYSVALVLVAIFCGSFEQAVKTLGCVCYFGATWYAYHGYAFFQFYKSIRQEKQLNNDLLSDLRRMWIARFVVPTGMSLIIGGFIMVGLQIGWLGK